MMPSIFVFLIAVLIGLYSMDIVEKYKKDGLKSWNPYGEKYKVEEVTFSGEQIPED